MTLVNVSPPSLCISHGDVAWLWFVFYLGKQPYSCLYVFFGLFQNTWNRRKTPDVCFYQKIKKGLFYQRQQFALV